MLKYSDEFNADFLNALNRKTIVYIEEIPDLSKGFITKKIKEFESLKIEIVWNLEDLINSGLRELYFTLGVIGEVISYMNKIEFLGDYHNNHPKYAELFKQILLKNDPKAYESAGMWYWYIEEMELGVI